MKATNPLQAVARYILIGSVVFLLTSLWALLSDSSLALIALGLVVALLCFAKAVWIVWRRL